MCEGGCACECVDICDGEVHPVEMSAKLGRSCIMYIDAGMELRGRLSQLNDNFSNNGYWFVGASRGGGGAAGSEVLAPHFSALVSSVGSV